MGFSCCQIDKSNTQLKQTADFLKIIAEENRLKILCILQKQEMCVCDIWQFLDLKQNLVSHHLKVLKDFKLIDFRKEKAKVIYSINHKELEKYKFYIFNFLNNNKL